VPRSSFADTVHQPRLQISMRRDTFSSMQFICRRS